MMEERMARIEVRLEHLADLAQRTLTQATATNGRVGVLERWRIEEDARRSERQELSAQGAERAAERVSHRARRIGVVVPVTCVVLGAVLSRLAELI